MNDKYREVDFFKFCKECKYKEKTDTEDPCHECLGHPVNLYSNKPVKWEAK